MKTLIVFVLLLVPVGLYVHAGHHNAQLVTRNAKYFRLEYTRYSETDTVAIVHQDLRCVRDVKTLPNGKYVYLEYTLPGGIRMYETEVYPYSLSLFPAPVWENGAWCEL